MMMRLVSQFRNRAIRTRQSAEQLWSTKHEGNPNWHELYWAQTPSREYYAKTICGLGDIDSVLEFGCNVGANLFAIHSVNPNTRLKGFDLNHSAIAFGQSKFQELGIDADISVKNLGELSDVPSNSEDCCYSKAVLQHLPPETYEAAIKDMYRIARKYVVCFELHPFSKAEEKFHEKQLLNKYGDRLQRNYWDEFQALGAAEEDICVMQSPPPINLVEVSDANAVIVVKKR